MRSLLGYMAVAAALMLGLSACATAPGAGPQVTGPVDIAVAVGPSFGFCPVYRVSIASSGLVTFIGERHTAVLGRRDRNVGAAAFRAVARDLARFQPASGTTSRIACDVAVTDTSSYTVSWSKADGKQAVASHQSGCPAGEGKSLVEVLSLLPERLGISDWSRQTTRPGASRG